MFLIQTVKNTLPWTYVISDLNGEEIVGTFYEKELQKKSKKFRVDKMIKRRGDKLYVKWKAMIILLIVGLIKKKSLYKMSYFPEPYTPSKNRIKN